jgi:hypothetical protein
MPKFELTAREQELEDALIKAVEDLLLAGPEAVGHVADHVGEYGTDSDYGGVVDGVVVECLTIVVDNVEFMGRL